MKSCRRSWIGWNRWRVEVHHHPRLLSRSEAARVALRRCCGKMIGTPIAGMVQVQGWVDLRKLADELYGPAVPVLPSYAAMATAMDSFYIDAEAAN